MEHIYLDGKRKGSSLLYLPTEKKLFFKTHSRRGQCEYYCYQRILLERDENSKNRCSARVTIKNGICSRSNTQHNDHDNHEKIFNDLIPSNKIKSMCATLGSSLPTHKISTKEIFYQELSNCRHESNLVYDKMKRQLLRLKNAHYPKIPKNLEEIRNALENSDIQEKFRMTSDNSFPLYIGTIVRKQFSFVVFASIKVIQIIRNHIPIGQRHYLMDGTFQIVPRIFYQLIVITIEFQNQIFPVFFILTTSKSAASYKAIFEYIEENVFDWKPTEIIADYENGIRKAVMEKLPEANLRGCWFHFCKAIRAKCGYLGMRSLFSRNAEAKRYYKQIMSLPLLSASDIEKGFECIKNAIIKNGLYEDFKELIDYFQNFWLKLNKKRSISVADLNMRTTSSLESLNSQLKRSFAKHGHIWRFIEQLRLFEFSKAYEMSQLIGGVFSKTQLERKRKRDREREDKIKYLTGILKRNEISIEQFLEAMSAKDTSTSGGNHAKKIKKN